MNVVTVIFPYGLEGVWVFDDAAVGLVREPFISGADNILDVLTENIPNATSGFKITFSARPFPGYTARFVWTRAEYGGNWYRWPEREMKDGCVRPLLKYFESPKKSSCRRPLKARDVLLASTIPAPIMTMLCDALLGEPSSEGSVTFRPRTHLDW